MPPYEGKSVGVIHVGTKVEEEVLYLYSVERHLNEDPHHGDLRGPNQKDFQDLLRGR